MAVTKIKPIRETVNKALAYILDPQKTDDAFYVSSYGCAASDAAAKEFEWTRNLAIQQGMQMPEVLARHLIQSFDIGEVTPEEAHEVGKQLADEWLKGKYEYVIARELLNGNYTSAEQNFSALSGYRDAASLSVYCKYAGMYKDIFLVAFPSAGGQLDTLSILIKVINLAALGQPLSVFVNGSHGQHDMAMRIVSGRIWVMDCKVTAHSLGHEMLSAVFLHHLRIHFGRDFSRQGKNESSGKLRVPLLFYFLDSVPERCPVCVFRRGICWKHNFRVKDFRLFSSMVFGFLVILGEQFFPGLVGSSGNGRAALAPLDDADFEMWYWHL